MSACTHVVIARRTLTLKYYTGSCLCLATERMTLSVTTLHCLLDLTGLPLSEPYRLRASHRAALPPPGLPPSRAAASVPPSEPRCRLRACLPPSRAAVSGPPSEPRCRPRASLRAALPSPGLPQSRAAVPGPPSEPRCRLLPALQGRAAACSSPPSHTPLGPPRSP